MNSSKDYRGVGQRAVDMRLESMEITILFFCSKSTSLVSYDEKPGCKLIKSG